MKKKNDNHLKRAHASLYVTGKCYKTWLGSYAKPNGHRRISVLIYSGTPKEIAKKAVKYNGFLVGNYCCHPRNFYVYVTEAKQWFSISRYLNVNPCKKPW